MDLQRKENLTQEFGDMFQRFARDFFSPELDSSDYGFRPRVEVEESEKGYRVSAELPGLEEKDISLSLKDNSLVLEGKRESSIKSDQAGLYRSEFSYGTFYRTIPLQEDVDDKNITATFTNGVLHVELVKKNDGIDKTRKIPFNK